MINRSMKYNDKPALQRINTALDIEAGQANFKRSGKLIPYHQGSLDGLCGLYSIINAFQIATQHNSNLGSDDWQELLYELAVATDDSVGVPLAMACGLNSGNLFRILQAGLRYMADEHDIILSARRFLRQTDRPPVHSVLQRLEYVLRQPNVSMILSLSGHLNHWTVIQRITQTSIELFDSSSYTRVMRRNIRMSYEHRLNNGIEHVLYTRAIFCVKCSP